MKIAVVSPVGRCGATVATLLLGYTMAYSQSKSVRLCYTGENVAIKRYTSKDTADRDATRTISQVSKLLEARAIHPEDLGDYCIQMGTNIDIMDSWDSSLTEDEVISLLIFTFSRNVTDYIFCDLAYDMDDVTSKQVLDECDAFIVVSEPSKTSLTLIAERLHSPDWPKDKPCMLLISKYDEAIGSVKNLAKLAGFKVNRTCKIHNNPFITRCCNAGDLDTIVPYILKKDPRVAELNNDLRECIQFLLSFTSGKIKWEG